MKDWLNIWLIKLTLQKKTFIKKINNLDYKLMMKKLIEKKYYFNYIQAFNDVKYNIKDNNISNSDIMKKISIFEEKSFKDEKLKDELLNKI